MAVKYLKHFPKPLLNDLVEGRWLPIVGAGLSKNAVLPSGQTMPLWKELGESFAEDMQDYKYTNPTDIISAYEYLFERPKLIEKLSELLFLDKAQPGNTHRAFCDLEFDIVCTTNFDFLLEKGYRNILRPCTPLIDEDQLSINRAGPRTALLKLHGDLYHPKRLVVTEQDYDLFLESYPIISTYLANLLITRTAVLIGYSLDDPDFRQLWQVVRERLGKARRPAYALRVDAQPAEVARFERRGVRVINLPGSKASYGKILSETFEELKNYGQKNSLDRSQITQGEPKWNLSLPRDSATRLCYFVLPFSAYPFYREQVFPLVQEAGLVPLTGDEVVFPSDNLVARTETLISRAALILVDAASDYAVDKVRIAAARKEPNRLCVVFEEGAAIPLNIENAQILRRPALTSIEALEFKASDFEDSAFLADLGKWFQKAAKELEPTLSNEARRLLSTREYRAAVISAITHLETTMRKQLDIPTISGRGSKPIPVRKMLDIANRENLLGKFEVQQVLRWLQVRNDIVHSNAVVSTKKAKEIVSGVEEITSSLRWQ